ncbi:UNKNOWN [Stylonychia lemnae]|uniref:YHYH domain-containing protein n=1 Tax=Stylonychia lemnae TaxID=5949 RepID=A0A078B648_STYLE|nr:UNKNOWN [Stylonychia lemnae]|eukprot:CDW88993.1 UNKNOWN [Stylonychia lemnae]
MKLYLLQKYRSINCLLFIIFLTQVTYTLQLCSNGKLDPDEQCDDGNLAIGDGCTSQCQVQDLYSCKKFESNSSHCWKNAQFTLENETNWNNKAENHQNIIQNNFNPSQHQQQTITRDLQVVDLTMCQALVAKFTTTATQYDTFSNLAAESMTCSAMNACQNGRAGICKWDRKFSMTCFAKGEFPAIRIQTNSYPNHCFQNQIQFPLENQIDFEVIFNLSPSLFLTLNLNSQVITNGVLCDLSFIGDLVYNTNYQFVLHSGNIQAIVGIALNGVPIHSGTSEFGVDAFFPVAYRGRNKPNEIDFDQCLGNGELSNGYHYYSLSPCMIKAYSRKQTSPKECLDIPACQSDKLKFMRTEITQATGFAPIGIALDGHVIFGPYNATGNLWQPCDVDACNGITVDNNYIYVSTMFHPYTVGCWGPANPKHFKQACTSQSKICTFGKYLESSIYLMAALVVLNFGIALNL